MKQIILAGFLLCGWLGCVLSVHSAEPKTKVFSEMERNHIRVRTPELFAKGNSFEIHLDSLADSAFCFPLPKGKVISAYGSRGGHSGSDIKTRANDTIRCVFDGIVRMAKHYGGYGKVVVVRHANGLETVYSHNSKNLVAVGDTVKAGQPVGLTGRTGRATTEHLHFEIRVNGQHINPGVLFDMKTGTPLKRTLICTKKGNHVKLVPKKIMDKK
ncbi:M23 family metallopeptidase [Phocaeicola sp.]|uniref:M23 family metallopeptidase n=1 Tax=Phocaeicola sp. TaxID=2773926 RepID=UPI0030789F11